MHVACVLTAAELDKVDGPPDVIVLPEGVDEGEIWMVSSRYPEAVVVGAVRVWEGKTIRMRGVVWHKGKNHIDYLKFGTDDRTSEGTKDPEQDPVAHFPELGFSVGVLICMDIGYSNDRVGINTFPFREKVLDSLRRADKKLLLCVPADMSGDWNVLADLTPFKGIYVALCNSKRAGAHQTRCKSFIAGSDGRPIVTQTGTEPTFADLTAFTELMV